MMNVLSAYRDGRLTIYLHGELDHHEVRQSMAAIDRLLDEYLPRTCVLDLADLKFMDSSGIAVVLHTLRRMNTLQGKLLLQNIPAQPYKVLRAAGIEKITEIKEECPK